MAVRLLNLSLLIDRGVGGANIVPLVGGDKFSKNVHNRDIIRLSVVIAVSRRRSKRRRKRVFIFSSFIVVALSCL